MSKSPAGRSQGWWDGREGSRTIDDVLPEDGDVVVPVAAGVFVVESQSVQQLVLDDAVADAAEALQRHHLLLPDAAHGGETAGGGGTEMVRMTEAVLLHRYTRVGPLTRVAAESSGTSAPSFGAGSGCRSCHENRSWP